MSGKAVKGLLGSSLAAMAVILASPQPGRATADMDPGAGAMFWQVAAAAILGSVFYIQRIALWVRENVRIPERARGFVFATSFALVAAPLTVSIFGGQPVPRFNDLLLVGIVLTSYLYSWEPAVYLLVISDLVSAWILPPFGSMRLQGVAEWYRLTSFTLLSIFLIALISRMKVRAVSEPRREPSYAMRSAVVGAD